MKPVHAAALVLCSLVTACSAPSPERAGNADDAIVGGVETKDFPAIGYLAIDVTVNGKRLVSRPFCTGTLVAPRAVLTAGHCVLGVEEDLAKLKCMDIQFHGYVFGTGMPGAGPVYPVAARPVVHADYKDDDFDTSLHDVAYLVLQSAPAGIRPARVELGHAGNCGYVATGYGRTSSPLPDSSDTASGDCNAPAPSPSASSSSPPAPSAAPSASAPPPPASDPPPTRKALVVCADAGFAERGMIQTYSDRGSACQGDSGGPLRVRGDDSIVGVASYIVGSCGANAKTYYAPLASNRAFVEEAIAKGSAPR